jgi:hypothetical protein
MESVVERVQLVRLNREDCSSVVPMKERRALIVPEWISRQNPLSYRRKSSHCPNEKIHDEPYADPSAIHDSLGT